MSRSNKVKIFVTIDFILKNFILNDVNYHRFLSNPKTTLKPNLLLELKEFVDIPIFYFKKDFKS